ncbi:protein kinase, putative [Trypanosoma cruzi marinkellei]|uniref:Protein kinase, putative n=1 Tax=Trypanosoma cruzi marinkellei TaxID=85056 RepID=K2PEK6_TRYCR|nr:protein kinase, putative [Trypanosoma cruzi marinkellei]
MGDLSRFGNEDLTRGKRAREDAIAITLTADNIHTGVAEGEEKEYSIRNSPQMATPNDPSAYYLNVRQVVFCVLQEHASEAALLTREKLVSSLCDACDTVAHQVPLEAPLDIEMLRKSVQKCLQGANWADLDHTRLDVIAENLTSRLAKVVPKLPLPILAGEEVVVEAQASSSRPAKRPRKGMSLNAVLQTYRFGGDESQENNVKKWRGGIFPTPPPLPSVFPESAVCCVNCVTFRNLPTKYYEPEGMKRQLDTICRRIPNAFFLNVYCIPGEGSAVVSFNSKETAAAVMFMVNSANVISNAGNDVNLPKVNVIAATESHQQLLWGPLVEQVKKLEEQWRAWHAKYAANPPYMIRQAWSRANSKQLQLEQELLQLTSNEKSGIGAETVGVTATPPSEEQLRKKLKILQDRLECKKIIDQAEGQMRELYGDACTQYLTAGSMEATYSTSKANVSNHRRLLFITDLPCRLDDAEVLQFIQIIGLQPVHIWRDPTNETAICVELPSVGHVFAVLRQLDGSGMRFCGAFFSRDRVVDAERVR